jgi:hypothetical protein
MLHHVHHLPAATIYVHHLSHLVVLHPGKFVAAGVLVGGIFLGGAVHPLEFSSPSSQPAISQLYTVHLPAAPKLIDGRFGPMGLVEIAPDSPMR